MGSRRGLWMAVALASAGIFAFGIHAAFLLAGSAQFRTFASAAVLAAAGVVSTVQLVVVCSARRHRVVSSGPVA